MARGFYTTAQPALSRAAADLELEAGACRRYPRDARV